ncbi:MAG: hypothetical protein ACYCYP_00595 [Leptospirales bacterium]
MSQFGVNSAANLDNPLPGVSEPRSRPPEVPVRREEPSRPRPEEVDSRGLGSQPELSGSGARRRVDFYA